MEETLKSDAFRALMLEQFNTVNDGKAWYGKNLTDTLNHLKPAQVVRRFEGSHNIAELVSHMCRWREYVLQAFKNGVHVAVSDYENFPKIDTITEDEWEQLLNQFTELTDQLQALLGIPHDLSQRLDGKDYTFWELLQGIIHHDIYHAGQINLLAAR